MQDCHMATLVESGPDVTLLFFTGAFGGPDLETAWDDQSSWIASRRSFSGELPFMALSNLLGRFVAPSGIGTLRDAINVGLEKEAFDRLKRITGVSGETLSKIVRIPYRTLARRKTFSPEESERILRVASVVQRAIDVLEDLATARRWLTTGKRALDDKTPLELCDTELGAREVEHLLGRIEHGVFT